MSGLLIAACGLILLSIALLGVGSGFGWWPFAAWTAFCVMLAIWLVVTLGWGASESPWLPSERFWTIMWLLALALVVWPAGLLVVGFISWLIRRLRGEPVDGQHRDGGAHQQRS